MTYFKDQDLALFKYLFESPSRSLTHTQIKENFYSNYKSIETKMWRFKGNITKKEEEKGMKRPQLLVQNNKPFHRERIYTPTSLALEVLIEDSAKLQTLKRTNKYGNKVPQEFFVPYNLYKTKELTQKEYFHNETINDLRFMLEDFYSGAYKFITFPLIRRIYHNKEKYKIIPDAVFFFDCLITENGSQREEKKRIALEYERTLKAQTSTYKDIFERYENETQIDAVFYVAKNESVFKGLQRNCDKLYKATKNDNVYLANLEDLKKAENQYDEQAFMTYDFRGDEKPLFVDH